MESRQEETEHGPERASNNNNMAKNYETRRQQADQEEERARRRKKKGGEKVFEKYSRKLLRIVVAVAFFVVNKLNEIYYNFR